MTSLKWILSTTSLKGPSFRQPYFSGISLIQQSETQQALTTLRIIKFIGPAPNSISQCQNPKGIK